MRQQHRLALLLVWAALVTPTVRSVRESTVRGRNPEEKSSTTTTSSSILPDDANEQPKDQQQHRKEQTVNPPNILIFLVDDLGWNQVGYHAAPTGNYEIKTPNIDAYAAAGLKLERSYMTPWCGPSRAAIMTGRTNSYNANVSTSIASFDDNIGYIAGLPAGTRTLATAFKEYGASIGKPYKAYYNGKWGIGVSHYYSILHPVRLLVRLFLTPILHLSGNCVDQHCIGYGIRRVSWLLGQWNRTLRYVKSL
jgi:Sulfatase